MYREFEEYASNFNLQEPGINRKFYHSQRVALLAARIAENLGWSLPEVLLAKQIGLLHDIGRLKEWSEKKTFNTNIDHGEYGVEVLEKDNYMQKFNITKDDFLTVCAAVYYHDKYAVPDDLKDNKQVLLVRDADKIDILNILSDGDGLEEPLTNHQISEIVKTTFNEEKSILTTDIKTYGDRVLRNLALIYDINYDYSLKIIKEQGYLDKYYETLNNKELYQGYFNKINNYIEKKLLN